MVQRELLASETGSYTIEVILALPADGPSFLLATVIQSNAGCRIIIIIIR